MRAPYLLSCAALVVMVTAAAAQDIGPMSKVRGANDKARQLLATGQQLSPTIRRLVAELESRDLIVLVSVEPPTPESSGRFRASTQFRGFAHGQRFASIWVDEWWGPRYGLGLLAHELQHCLEVAQAPWVVSQRTMYELFSRIGREGQPQHFETEAAIDVEARVRAETSPAMSTSRARAHGVS